MLSLALPQIQVDCDSSGKKLGTQNERSHEVFIDRSDARMLVQQMKHDIKIQVLPLSFDLLPFRLANILRPLRSYLTAQRI